MPTQPLSRRAVLRGMARGVGVALALPFLDAMTRPLYANPLPGRGNAAPTRFATLYFPNGAPPKAWDPGAAGRLESLSPILEPLAAHRGAISVLSGLTHRATNTGDGHYFKTAAFLTGTTITKTTGADINAGGVSIDQLIADRIGRETRLPSLELSANPVTTGVDSNVGVTRVYGSHISWRTPTTPSAREIDPKQAFQRLFVTRNPMAGNEDQLNILDEVTILDAIQDDAKALSRDLGREDRHKLDEYLTSVRDVERRLKHDIVEMSKPRSIDPAAKAALPQLEQQIDNEPYEHRVDGYRNRIKHLLDIMVLAFWTDTTRVSSLMFGNSVSNQSFPWLAGVPAGHHDCSHHGDNGDKQRGYEAIARWHVEQFAGFLDKLANIDEGGSSLLDNSIILFGSSLGDGNRHSPKDLPLVLAGRAGGRLKPGRHIRCDQRTPFANLFVDIAGLMGAPVDSFADSTGNLQAIYG